MFMVVAVIRVFGEQFAKLYQNRKYKYLRLSNSSYISISP